MAKVLIDAYVEEKEFKNDSGEVVKFLSLTVPVTDEDEKAIKVDQFLLKLARNRALNKTKNPFAK